MTYKKRIKESKNDSEMTQTSEKFPNYNIASVPLYPQILRYSTIPFIETLVDSLHKYSNTPRF